MRKIHFKINVFVHNFTNYLIKILMYKHLKFVLRKANFKKFRTIYFMRI